MLDDLTEKGVRHFPIGGARCLLKPENMNVTYLKAGCTSNWACKKSPPCPHCWQGHVASFSRPYLSADQDHLFSDTFFAGEMDGANCDTDMTLMCGFSKSLAYFGLLPGKCYICCSFSRRTENKPPCFYTSTCNCTICLKKTKTSWTDNGVAELLWHLCYKKLALIFWLVQKVF